MTPRFTVDTHLFRELGALLVGRDSTALVELVKNAYDADATQVTVHGEDLATGNGRILISDDGIGMTRREFEEGFLRIASRLKEGGNRTSARFGRRYTGAKGVGRLSAHKLSSRLLLESRPDPTARSDPGPGVSAEIDWNLVEQFPTLDEVDEGLTLRSLPGKAGTSSGTVVILDRLRRRWTEHSLTVFLGELEAFQPPELLSGQIVEAIASGPFLFGAPQLRTRARRQAKSSVDPGFTVEATGDFAAGDDYWDRVAQRANWLIEVSARAEGVKVLIAPTSRGPTKGSAGPEEFEWPHPDPDSGPFFDARILTREGSPGTAHDPVADFARRVAGIRVYMEGFRVLPYGAPGDDWLELDRDYTRRTRELNIPKRIRGSGRPTHNIEAFRILGNQSYVGAVFLTADRSRGLEMVVSREGFVPNEHFHAMREIVRSAVDLCTRVRAASAAQRPPSERPSRRTPTDRETTESSVEHLREMRATMDSLTRAVPATFRSQLRLVSRQLDQLSEDLEAMLGTQSTLRVLASVGQQLAEFIHETNGMLASARQVHALLAPKGRAAPSVESVRTATEAAEQLVRLIERHASYLVAVLGADARRRRSRQPVAKLFQSALQLVSSRIDENRVEVLVDIAPRLTSSPMFAAELLTVFTNLLTNAVKASDRPGHRRISVVGRREGPDVVVQIANTGAAVTLAKSEQWFEPFRSTTTKTDPVLGQGMGLGLPIVRATLDDYSGSVQFVTPPPGFATAIEVRLPSGTATS